MKKIFSALLAALLCSNAGAQEHMVFPKFPVFAEMEDVVGNQFQTYLKLNAYTGLNEVRLQDMLKVVATAEEVMNRNWQNIYLGYIKRVETNVCFKTAGIIAQQPGFYQNQKLMNLALDYISRGFSYLNQYNHRDYPPYIIINTKYESGRPVSDEKAYVPVDETIVSQLKAIILENTGNPLEALADYYLHFGENYFFIPYGKEPGYAYNQAMHILDLSRLLKQYDQKLVDFCVKLLTWNKRPDAEQSGHMKPDELKRWKEVETKIYVTLDELIELAPPDKKYGIILPDSYPSDYTSSSFEWMIPFINNFDMHNRLQTTRDDPATNALTLNLMKFCVFTAEKQLRAELDTAANAMLQRHFREVGTVMRNWFGRGNDFQCSNIQWVAAWMDKYPIDEDDKKYILKAVKKCKNYK